jgi:hypothetical protein
LHSLYKPREKNKKGGSSVSQSQKEKQNVSMKWSMCVDFAKQMNITPQWMRTGQRQSVVPAWYKWYCTAGAWKLPYHAARTVRA